MRKRRHFFIVFTVALVRWRGGRFVFILWDKFNWFEARECVCLCFALAVSFLLLYADNSTENDIQILFVITLSIHHTTFGSLHLCVLCVNVYVCVLFLLWVRAKISLSNLIIKFITYGIHTTYLFWLLFIIEWEKCMTFHSSAMTHTQTISCRILKFGK